MTAIGIDLGTTNSVAAHYDPGTRQVRVLSTSFGENFTPSVVSVKRPRGDGGDGEVLVGRAAANYAPSAPEETILSIKRLMGRDRTDPQIEKVAKEFNYHLDAGPDGDPRVHVRLNGRAYTPAEISGLILRRIREDASQALGQEVTHAVITVPAYFNESQRAATREAGERAGLVVKKIIDEPTAAAIAFGFQAAGNTRHRLLVYDLGGGTFDISLVQMVKDQQGRDQLQGLQIEGDNWLGGDDFDRHVVERIIAWVRQQTQEDPSADKRFLLLARGKAEEAKRALGASTETDVVLSAAYKLQAGTFIDVDFPLSRDDLEEMIRPHVERSMELVQKALREQSLTPDDVTDVLLVGGATLTPLVARAVEGLFGAAKVRRTVNPMECVARGAAILAATLEGVECPNPECKEVNDEAATECQSCGGSLAGARSVGDTGITEPTAMSLGIATLRDARKDVFVPIIPKGTIYPLREPLRKRFQASDNRRIVVPVYEGDDPVASKNSYQGVIEYELPAEIADNSPVDVSFNYDRNRQLTVTVSIPGTSLFKSETLQRDRPRPRPEPDSDPEAAESEESWQDELADTIEFARRFIEHYRSFMEASEAVVLKRHIDQAMHLLSFPDEVEGRRLNRVLQMSFFNCGLATQLFLADRVTSGAPPEEARQISESARQVRESFERGDRARAEEQARLLKVMVAKTIQRRAGVKEIADQEDPGGLLRWLGQ